MIIASTQWTAESIAAVIVVPLLAIGFLIVAFVLRRQALKEDRTDKWNNYWIWQGFAIACLVGAVISSAGLAWGMYPWKAEYHQWRPVSGVVASVDKRLVSTGDKSMEDKFVVTFTGSGQPYGVLDTRAAGLKVGDRLSITCVRRWQYSGTDGYDCNFVDMERS